MDKTAKFGKRTKFKEFKKKQVELTDEERKIVKDSKAEWSGGNSAVWKAQDNDGDTMYITHTHRAFNTAPTLKGAISRFHNFIKSTASEYSETGLEKVAKENGMNNTDKKKIDAKDVALAGSSLGAIGASKNMILGKKRMYHGTSKENWDKIKTQGLMADRGGLGGASQSVRDLNYIDRSKGQVHLTRFNPYARTYAGLHNPDLKAKRKILNDFEDKFMNVELRNGSMSYGVNEEFRHKQKEIFDKWQELSRETGKKETGMFVKSFFGAPTPGGKVLKVNMDYDKFKNMSIDDDGGLFKNMAAKGNINVSPEEIAGSSAKMKDRIKHTAKALPGYIKNNPLRFGGGLALAGAGAYGLKKLKDKKKQELEKTAGSEDYDVCCNCGRKRNERIEPHCKDCGHDHTMPKKDYDKDVAGKAKNVCENCGYGWVNEDAPGCKKCGHDMSISRDKYVPKEKKASQVHYELQIEKVAVGIEKTALNAQKARAMAKEVGLLPLGNWKSGLRNMRNMNTGDLLQGKELAQAKAKMGALSNNAYQKLKSQQRKLPSNTEISGVVNRNTGGITDMLKGPNGKGVSYSRINGKGANLHTHPIHSGEDRFLTLSGISNTLKKNNHTIKRSTSDNFDENIMRFIDPKAQEKYSRGESLMDVMKPKRNPLSVDAGGGITYLGGSKLTADNNSRRRIKKSFERELNDKDKLVKFKDAQKNFNLELGLNNIRDGVPDTSSDAKQYILNHLSGEGQKQTIVNPNQDYEAIHKMSPYKKSSIFFDRSPRKTR